MDEAQLFSDADAIIKFSNHFREQIEFAESSWDTELEALNLFESQVGICQTIKDLVKNDRYVEAFILNRSVFENYFLISLILKGTKYVMRYKVSTKPGETAKQAYTELVAKLEKQRAEGRKDIVSFRPTKAFKQIEIIHRGLFSKDGDRLVPIYHFVFNEYDPIWHRIYKIPSIASKELFTEFLEKFQQRHEALYREYLRFEKVLEAAVLNDLISEGQKIRVKVHYNFLSGFTHLTEMSFNLTKSYDWRRNVHYLRELNILYIIRLLRLYLLLLIDFFSKTNHKIREVDRLLSNLDEIGKKYDYFWFIFNKSSEYDFWKYQTAKEYRRGKGELLDEEIPYYKDPYERLVNQHKTIRELSTGQIYKSPWPLATQ